MYQITLTRNSIKELKKILKSNPFAGEQIKVFLLALNDEPNPKALLNAKKLKGYKKDMWRWRVGEYRIIAEIIEDQLIIEVIKISNRSKAYKK
ncbi:MAG: type II toxin-antitoxin system mRNA interferase toxin, RelE/StbE family [Proteobacteria bacterium]|nr:MAG: type II toxin-antitoxin system mRNA interferase toxin, RelE/StbE family [Pseudomonadota bacterium]